MKQRGVLTYLMYINKQSTPLSTGDNHIRKSHFADFYAEPVEDHLLDITIDKADCITVKNLVSTPVTLRICSFSKPTILMKNRSHTFKRISQLSIVFGIEDQMQKPKLALDIKRQLVQQENKPERKRLKKLIELARRKVPKWGELESNAGCPICLRDPVEEVGRVECGHAFCSQCIDSWAAQATFCPLCKKPFKYIAKEFDGITLEKVQVKPKVFEESDENEEPCFCYECSCSGNEDQLLMCDECDMNYCHTYCAGLDGVPENSWLCKYCSREVEDLFGGNIAN
eukprot:TRINITY_DN5934_c0_g1_i13.p2 TRINITY_DN5934_c0_g1~~TRINITY_DN5934_c0_g1_i13.p2  ORF type:complete len:284 (-),score=102.28 TRINITY_DN5934_c0_g1_i13:1072-1923(-)